MTKKLQAVRGTKDWFAQEFEQFLELVTQARNVALNYGCKDLATPIFEFAEVFTKSLGETSDVVGKEMYTLNDKGGELLTLRPEFTAGLVRAFFANGFKQHLPLKLFSYGPVFRYERPQRGRFRQFHQLNVEFLGINDAFVDAELISCAYDILLKLSKNNLEHVTLEINSLGNSISRASYRKTLVEYLKDFTNDLSEDSQKRLIQNPLRILDSKDEGDRKIIVNAPILADSLDQESQGYFARVLALLDNLEIGYKVNDKLVRGLDYYDHTIFEFTTTQLGAQGTILAGGRYNGLYQMMGGDDVPAIGFAAGIERLLELFSSNINIKSKKPIVIAAIGDEAKQLEIKLAKVLREQDFYIEVPYNKKDIAKKLQFANKINAVAAIIFGKDELEKNQVKVKNLLASTEEVVNISQLIDYLANFRN
ncbi:histidine--tRNA ligase [Rickettsiales endosymbiont of Stachyamoeba lipophora]|uniref:histidine--tRNA ligase n=1 Tax=Rickettsiales endosymbiont of Stachyamoeba lipophora TaxID=2486578 RepID=UPI000F647F97|nr:histidine--tRNA ligase [Rickettsiales endosymbiont of Stachyamoeba lipophora]AZL15261.1 histidine--tRNA ligase [Rickettsiales endosymbiont of Stachyamoeba lipophora]